MKISNSTPNYINQTYTNQANSVAGQKLKSQQPPAEEGLKDSINLSDRTKDLQRISKAIETEPAGRNQVVAELKQQVENNQYNVNAEKVAEKMVGLLFDGNG